MFEHTIKQGELYTVTGSVTISFYLTPFSLKTEYQLPIKYLVNGDVFLTLDTGRVITKPVSASFPGSSGTGQREYLDIKILLGDQVGYITFNLSEKNRISLLKPTMAPAAMPSETTTNTNDGGNK